MVSYNMYKIKEGKVHPVTYRDGTEEEQKYGSVLSLTSVQDGQCCAPTTLLQERFSTCCIGGWVQYKAVLDGAENAAIAGF